MLRCVMGVQRAITKWRIFPFNLRKRTNVATVNRQYAVGFTFIRVYHEDTSFVIRWLIYDCYISLLFGFLK